MPCIAAVPHCLCDLSRQCNQRFIDRDLFGGYTVSSRLDGGKEPLSVTAVDGNVFHLWEFRRACAYCGFCFAMTTSD